MYQNDVRGDNEWILQAVIVVRQENRPNEETFIVLFSDIERFLSHGLFSNLIYID